MKGLKQLSLALGMAALVSPAFAQVVVTVDDVPGNDAAYVDGTGGNLSGAGALQAAVNAVNNDASGAATYEINIVDTDGVADVYVGSLQILMGNLTIQQVENGGGTSVGATIQGDNSVGVSTTVLAQAPSFTLAGISKAKPLTIDCAIDTTAATGTELNATNGTTITWKNLVYIDSVAPNAGLTHNQWNITITEPQTTREEWIGCVPNFNNGIQHYIPIFLTDCQIGNGGNWYMVGFAGEQTFTDCTLNPGAGFFWGNSDWPGISSATFNNCTFKMANRLLHTRDVNQQPLTLTFNGGDFSQTGGDIVINAGSRGADDVGLNQPQTVTFNDVDFSGMFANGSVLGVRLSGGSLTLNRCTGTGRGGAGFADASAGLISDMTYNVNQCIFGDGMGEFGGAGGATANSFKLTINVTNSIFYGTTPAGHILHVLGAQAGPDTINLLHSTFVIGTGDAYFFGDGANGDQVKVDGTILNPSKISASHVLSSIPVVTATPHIPNVTYVNVADDGTGNPYEGNPLNGTPNLGADPPITEALPAFPGDHVVDPQLDAMGRPQITSGVSPIAAEAFNSTLTIDVDGEARPQPAGTQRDIGADETAAIPVTISDFSME